MPSAEIDEKLVELSARMKEQKPRAGQIISRPSKNGESQLNQTYDKVPTFGAREATQQHKTMNEKLSRSK